MARTKEFDPDAALDAALDLFWERGYEATSIQDLVDHLGIGRGSLYATFGSKHALYLKALDRYLRTRDPNPIELLSRPGPALPAVRALVRAYVDEAVCDTRRRGCMIVNAAMERVPADALVTRRVQESWAQLERALTCALTRARDQGELAADKDPVAIARFLLVVLQGLRVVGKAGPNARSLHDAAALALSILD
ncbi:MAG: TetR/AcrR family transcriptional regulator [Actinomycetes bacterium]|jgi:TetR/AcrR family transcriptional repressor of nem operon|nr:TetR/AcrR family transcriptional regulator [Longimicrobiales bacterium]